MWLIRKQMRSGIVNRWVGFAMLPMLISVLIIHAIMKPSADDRAGATQPAGHDDQSASKAPPQESAAVEVPPAPSDSSNAGGGIPEMPMSDAEAFQAIHEASIQYEAGQIPVITPYLSHPNQVVRQAAVDGLIVLGERGAAVPLREAAKQLDDPREAVIFLDAADYLELPSFRSRRKPGD